MITTGKKIRLLDVEKLKRVNSDTLQLYSKYKIDMTIRELSIKTMKGYENDLYNWFIYILDNQDNKPITELKEDDIIEFIYFCKLHGNQSRRIRRRLASISALYLYLRRKKIINENPMEFVERAKKDTDIIIQTFLTKEQIDLMKEKLIENGDLQLELYALLSLSTMARVNAISNIKWDQIDFKTRTINDVWEKEGKIVTLYFNQEVKDKLLDLQIFREERQVDDKGYVFVAKYKQEINKASTESLWQWCKKIGQLIDVPTLHPHDFRHSGSQLLKLAGCPIEKISEFLNHSSLDVTKKHYLRQNKQEMLEVKDKYEI